MENNTEKLLHYLYECSEEGVIPKIHSEDLMNLDFLKPFIKWLVYNDKIDFREDFYLEDQHGGGFGEDEDIIMLLAIQDDPISFLCEILK